MTHARLGELPPERQEQEICADRRALVAMGFEVRALAYPYGSFDAHTAGIAARCGYAGARGSGRSGGGPFQVATAPAVVRGTGLEALRGYVTGAERRGDAVVVLVFHDVCARCGEYAVDPGVLDSFLGWLAERGTPVRTFSDALAAAGTAGGGAAVATPTGARAPARR
ncbi:polysaccharide deacetylase family protein [Thermocatellispora tengchongensis]|uniref:polysaccharide deacetylase family protein n=1 Tax=Thermocatellispora tengchongensis TaxID=1073253 RepID=UPI00363FB2FE